MLNYSQPLGLFSVLYIEDLNLGKFLYYYLLLASPNLVYPVIGGVIWIVLHMSRKEFRFYFAKAFVGIASKEKEEAKKVKYVIEGIKFYNRYLRRNLNLQINDIKTIYSKLIIDPNVDKNKVIQSLSESFGNDKDKLKPAQSLLEIANVQKTGNFLIEKSLGQKIKDLATYFATIIPLIVAVIQLLFPAKQPQPGS